jgi:hypothetical protein
MTPSDLAYLSEALNHVFRARGDIDCLAFFSGTVVGEQVEWHWIAQDVMGFAPNEIVARQTSTVGSEQGRYTSRESIKIDPAGSYRLELYFSKATVPAKLLSFTVRSSTLQTSREQSSGARTQDTRRSAPTNTKEEPSTPRESKPQGCCCEPGESDMDCFNRCNAAVFPCP